MFIGFANARGEFCARRRKRPGMSGLAPLHLECSPQDGWLGKIDWLQRAQPAAPKKVSASSRTVHSSCLQIVYVDEWGIRAAVTRRYG